MATVDKKFENLLFHILHVDNTIRNSAEAAFNKYKQEQPDEIIGSLISVLRLSTHDEVCETCAWVSSSLTSQESEGDGAEGKTRQSLFFRSIFSRYKFFCARIKKLYNVNNDMLTHQNTYPWRPQMYHSWEVWPLFCCANAFPPKLPSIKIWARTRSKLSRPNCWMPCRRRRLATFDPSWFTLFRTLLPVCWRRVSRFRLIFSFESFFLKLFLQAFPTLFTHLTVWTKC